jgi:SAM-dependent methyltransferase
MTEFEDTFGMAFMAHHKGEASVHQTERDDGLIRESDASMYFQSYDEWPEYEREAILKSKGRVLDVGLGAGRHSLWLQEKGYDVVGMDLSPLAVEGLPCHGHEIAGLPGWLIRYGSDDGSQPGDSRRSP